MSSAQLYVWGGGRWREVCARSGRVAGWGAARFVCARGGRLQLASRARVLRGLRALLAGAGTTVHDGPPLPQIRLNEQIDVAQRKGRAGRNGHEGRQGREGCAHCCEHRCWPAPPAHHQCRCVSEANFNRLLRTDASTQVASPSASAPASAPAPACASAPARPAPATLTLRDSNRITRPLNNENMKRVAPGGDGPPAKRPRRDRRAAAEGERGREEEGETCTELIIEEETVALLRGFVQRGAHAHSFPVDLLRFDEDDDYKRLVFFRLNPLVRIARSRRVERLLRARRTHDDMKRDFASLLGLQSVDERSSQDTSSYRTRTRTRLKKRNDAERRRHVDRLGSVDSGTDKENREMEGGAAGTRVLNGDASAGERRKATEGEAASTANRARRRNADAVVAMSGEGKEPVEEGKRNLRASTTTPAKPADKPTVTAKKRSSAAGGGGGGREYSRLEDEAIVRWVRGGSRARLVNGNRLWRDLPPLHHQRTGRWRSWHSLRNRYLRYVLPRLAALALPAAEAARLRAAAAAGELKSRKAAATARRNSVFVEPRVRSAWARRPRPPPSPPSPSTPPTPPARSRSPSPSPRTSPRTRPPSSYSPSAASSSDSNSSPSRTTPRESTQIKRRKLDEGVQSKRVLRSSAASSTPPAPAHAHALRHEHARARAGAHTRTRTPTYSELTRRFASPRASSESEPPAPRRTPRSPRTPAPAPTHARRLYNPKDAL